MQNTKALRVRYNNEWPSRLLFPAELSLQRRLDENNLQQAFSPAKLNYSDDQEFHVILSHLLEALDNLPFRPDMAFDAIWKALDAEFVRIKSEDSVPQHISRFDAFQTKIITDPNTSQAFLPFSTSIPMQTCEFVAKRIFNGTVSPDEHSEPFLKRVKACFGDPLLTQFLGKYIPDWPTNSKLIQRKGGSFIWQLLRGRELEISGTKHLLSQEKSLSFLISVVMPQYRNERFHGTTTPPFRSSAAKMKTYAHAYFVFMVAYTFLLEIFLYRGFGVIDATSTIASAQKNHTLFLQVFGSVLDK